MGAVKNPGGGVLRFFLVGVCGRIFGKPTLFYGRIREKDTLCYGPRPPYIPCSTDLGTWEDPDMSE